MHHPVGTKNREGSSRIIKDSLRFLTTLIIRVVHLLFFSVVGGMYAEGYRTKILPHIIYPLLEKGV
jgi:hypothetical protein